jgi:hypothetical protein
MSGLGSGVHRKRRTLHLTVGAFAFSGMERYFAMSHGVLSESISYEPVISSSAKIAKKPIVL